MESERQPASYSRTRPAAVSIASNILLILLKLVAGVLTGSIAIFTEAIHSGIDLLASIIAYFSVRQAEVPADETHRYGHEKFENVAAAVEGALIILGAGVIIFTAAHSLIVGPELSDLGIGIVVVAFAIAVNVGVSAYLFNRARLTHSAALEGDAAHLRADAWTSAGVLVGLVLVKSTGYDWIDPVIALIIAATIVRTGARLMARAWRVLVDESLPAVEVRSIHETIESFPSQEIAGYHKLRTRRAGSRRYIDVHVQFVDGTSLERAHQLAHELQDALRHRVPNADVLIHLEPESAGEENPSKLEELTDVDPGGNRDREQHSGISEVTGYEQ